LESFITVFAAYALYRGTQFNWRDRHLTVGYTLIPICIIFVLAFHILIEIDAKTTPKILHQLPLIPNMILSAGALGFLGCMLCLEPLAYAVRWPVAFIFATYVVFNILGFVNIRGAVDPRLPDPETIDVFRTLYAALKFTLFIAFLAVIVSARSASLVTTGTTPPSEGQQDPVEQAQSFVKKVQLVMWLFTAGFGAVILYRKAVIAFSSELLQLQ
jgi:hypothetical protein